MLNKCRATFYHGGMVRGVMWSDRIRSMSSSFGVHLIARQFLQYVLCQWHHWVQQRTYRRASASQYHIQKERQMPGKKNWQTMVAVHFLFTHRISHIFYNILKMTMTLLKDHMRTPIVPYDFFNSAPKLLLTQIFNIHQSHVFDQNYGSCWLLTSFIMWNCWWKKCG